jgi:RND family efflux transporter MFP subunit
MRSAFLLILSLMIGTPAAAEPPKGPPPAPVRAEAVVGETVREGRTFVGSVRPLRRAQLASGVDGFLKSLKAREGQRLGDKALVAELEMDEIGPQLEAARATLEAIGHEITELENGTRKEVLSEAEARIAEAEVELATTQRRLETARRLRESKNVSADEVRDAEDAVRAAEAKLRRVRAGHALLVAGTREEQLDQARSRKKRQQAEVARLVALEARHTIRAPFAAYVVEEHSEEGTWLSRGDAVVTIEALDTVRARFPVLEDYIGAVKPGDEVVVQITSIPGRVFNATVERIVPTADRVTRTVPVDVLIENVVGADGTLLIKSGMFARTVLAVGTPAKSLLVPLDALVLGGPSPMVFVVSAESPARPVPVELGAIFSGRAVVKGALKAGDLVVTEGNERLRPGQAVKILER